MSVRTAAGLAALLLACRPAAAPPAEPLRAPSFFALTPERLYTDAPVGDGISFVPVTERSLERRAGGVELAIHVPVVALPDEELARELTAAIAGLAELERWAGEEGEARVGAVLVACTAGLATTALVSVVCERLDTTLTRDEARAGTGGAPAGPTIAARVFAVDASPVHALAWRELLRPGASAQDVLGAALTLGDLTSRQREAWRAGECAAGEPGFSLDAAGLTLWPDVSAEPCAPLRLGGDALAAFLVPGGLVARALRTGETPASAPD